MSNVPFRVPGATDRTTIIGATGTGKSTCGAWLLSMQRLDKRPWIVFDFKHDTIFDYIGWPPLRDLSVGEIPRKPGLYISSPKPGTEDDVEDWLWRIWERENIGIYVDEATLMPDGEAWRAILQQGRSKRIPVIACTQRPVDVKRALFSEASYFGLYRMQDKRDYRTIEGFVPADLSRPLPQYWWRWYDVARNKLLTMKPVPEPKEIGLRIKREAPILWTPLDGLFRNASTHRG